MQDVIFQNTLARFRMIRSRYHFLKIAVFWGRERVDWKYRSNKIGEEAPIVLSIARRSIRQNVVSCAHFRCRVSMRRATRWDASGSISVLPARLHERLHRWQLSSNLARLLTSGLWRIWASIKCVLCELCLQLMLIYRPGEYHGASLLRCSRLNSVACIVTSRASGTNGLLL